jgi:hypothetical protein
MQFGGVLTRSQGSVRQMHLAACWGPKAVRQINLAACSPKVRPPNAFGGVLTQTQGSERQIDLAACWGP